MNKSELFLEGLTILSLSIVTAVTVGKFIGKISKYEFAKENGYEVDNSDKWNNSNFNSYRR